MFANKTLRVFLSENLFLDLPVLHVKGFRLHLFTPNKHPPPPQNSRYFSVVLLITFSAFKSLGEYLKAFLCGAVNYAVRGGSNILSLFWMEILKCDHSNERY